MAPCRDRISTGISKQQPRPIRYQISIAKLKLSKDVDEDHFANTPGNEAPVRDLAIRDRPRELAVQ